MHIVFYCDILLYIVIYCYILLYIDIYIYIVMYFFTMLYIILCLFKYCYTCNTSISYISQKARHGFFVWTSPGGHHWWQRALLDAGKPGDPYAGVNCWLYVPVCQSQNHTRCIYFPI